jgi:molybdate transport system ATP-binding protein
MTDHRPALEVRVSRRVHEGLAIDAELTLDGGVGVIFGPSGAGKSTLLRLIAGLTRPNAGRVAVGGEALFDSERRVDVRLKHRRIGMIFQDDLLFPHLRVGDNIGFGLKDESRDRRASRLAEVAATCGVAHLLDRWPATLSGGERQRVGLARALAPRPRLLLCDEPVSALDLPNRHALLEGLRRIQQAEGTPVLYVTHSPAEAIALGTRLFLMEHGRMVADGPPLDVLANSRHAAFLHLEGVRNVFAGRVAEHSLDQGSTRLELEGGPSLIVPRVEQELGAAMIAEIRGDDVLLSLGPVSGLSARNLIEGVVEAVVPHGHEAEIVVRTGGLRWLVSTVGPASGRLALSSGQTVYMIIKARSCRVAPADPIPV